MTVLEQIWQLRTSGGKALAVLVDPDKASEASLKRLAQLIAPARVSFVFVGGSLLTQDRFHDVVNYLRSLVKCPVVLFPGSPSQLSDSADAVLLLSLISGRNPDLLIGQHVVAASRLRSMKLEVIPTGYMLVDGGQQTTASYISQTMPLPYDKPGLAAMTALAGHYLGLQVMYLDAGSGAQRPVSAEMIRAVREVVPCPLIAGGGIRTSEDALEAWNAGADLIVVGTAWEENEEVLIELGMPKKNHPAPDI